MNLKRSFFVIILVFTFLNVRAQMNQTDQNGLKQGHWIRTYPDGSKMYEGIFINGHPAGEFKRFYENGRIKSIMIFSENGKEADAVLYYPDGKMASRGKYVNQKKEGKWQFYSSTGGNYLICEQSFVNDLREGISLGFYPDGKTGDRTMYQSDLKNGLREQFYENGAPYTRSNYKNGKLEGTFEAWFPDGKKMYSGAYRNDVRDGLWIICNEDGSLKYRVEYRNGVPDNPDIDNDVVNYINSLEKQKGKIPDPEKTGEMW